MAGSHEAVPVAGEAFRGLAGYLATGVSLVVAMVDDEPIAVTAGSVVAAFWNPPPLAVFLRAGSRMEAALNEAGRFTVSILGETSHGLARQFARSGRGQGWIILLNTLLPRPFPSLPVVSAVMA